VSKQAQHVLVIGGSHGISLELVRRLRNRDVSVTCVSRTAGELKADLQQDDQLEHIERDVTSDDFGDLSIPDALSGFVYCPGSINLGPLKAAKPELLRKDFELNVVGAMRCCQAALPALKASGQASAVFFSTVAAVRGIEMHSYVAAAKGALLALARTWAAELAPEIRVNCIAPALTDTPLAHDLLSTEAKRQAMSAKYPMGRFGKASDIAAMADFLLSEQSGWITGQTLSVDGGMSGIVRL